MLSLAINLPFGSSRMDLISLEEKLGAATMQKSRVYYEFNGKRVIKGLSGRSETYDVTTTLSANVSKGKIVLMEIWHVTSD